MQTQLYYYHVILCVAKIIYDSCAGKYSKNLESQKIRREYLEEEPHFLQGSQYIS